MSDFYEKRYCEITGLFGYVKGYQHKPPFMLVLTKSIQTGTRWVCGDGVGPVFTSRAAAARYQLQQGLRATTTIL